MKEPKHSLWARLQDATYAHPKLTIGLTVGMIIVALGAPTGAWFLLPQTQTNNQTAAVIKDQEPPTPAQKFYSPLTGVEVADEAATKRQVTALMLENSMYARPQSGIKDSGVVFEAIAEGGITRLAALYQEQRPQMIGPVRSVRPYYIDWMAPFDAAIGHVGGSFNALNTIRNGTFKDIDQFFNGAYYQRATDREAPHNVYTSFDKLDELNQKKGFTSSAFTGWERKAEHPAETPTANKINVSVSGAAYNVAYDYDKTTNSYIRFLGGEPSKDREAGQVTPKVVIVLKIPTHLGFEDGYREQMDTNGVGDAFIFQDGTAIKGHWRKDGQKAQMTFYDNNGRRILLNAGQTWMTVVAPEKNVSWQ
ncbi:MAG TPA: DUF3048 domain-containing protein [Magnetospirillaceae bacterium]|nr:DUF3048 domain-containing protein [Magnetospirillaceae bacterium]